MTDKETNLIIRIAGIEDISILVNYRLLYLEELQGEMNNAYKKQLTEDLQNYFRKAITEKRFLALFAELGNNPVGFGAMVLKEIPGDAYKTIYLEADILNMYTLPAYRRKGISSHILERLIAEAKKMGISKLALHTSKDGEELYKKYGFKIPLYPYLERISE